MNSKQLKTSALAVTAAVAIALSGTFAWQSVSQTAMNESTRIINPGGRLHDDFSGYGPTDTKDIYVENFSTLPIYARVRLDEYMEIGEGASLKSLDGTIPNPDNKAVSLVSGAKIDDPTTWTTHKPDSTANPGTPETPADATADPFHDYWTWTMGGQTVYMPTFNKNKDSLRADINGMLAGKDATDDIFYDDYVKYAAGDTKIATEYADADADATDECGPDGGPGGIGVVDVNYTETIDVTHTAKETLTAQVITMAEYTALSDAEKTALNAWVYDADGWAYWSQPIQPGEATGLLLDQITLTTDPNNAWYYAINAVAQFVTDDDLGRLDNTGFYTDYNAETGTGGPSDAALALLDYIGVNTSSVDGSITITATADAGAVTAAVPGKTIDLAATVAVTGVDAPVQDVTWTLTGNTSTSTTLVGTTLTVGADETAGGALRIVAASSNPDYSGLKGRLTLPVTALSYTVDIMNAENTSVTGTTMKFRPYTEAAFSLNITSTPAGYIPNGSWSWSSGNSNIATVTASGTNNTSVTVKVPYGATIGNTTTITATNGSLTTSFTVEVFFCSTMTVDEIEYYVLVENATITGKAQGESTASTHNAALLLSKNVLEKRAMGSTKWSTSSLRTYLNSSDTGNWLENKIETQSKAITVTNYTRGRSNDNTEDNRQTSEDMVFLLSEADINGCSNMGSDKSPQSWEYSYNGKKLECFTSSYTWKAQQNDGTACGWLLRSQALQSYNEKVSVVSDSGGIDCVESSTEYGVRPAFWYNLDA